RCVFVLFVKGVGKTHTFDRRLLDAVRILRRGDPADFEERRDYINDVTKLVADAAEVFDVTGPRDTHALPDAAKVRGNLLGPGIRRVECPRPAYRHVIVGAVRAPDIVEIFQLVRDRDLDAIEHGHFVRCAN